MFITRICLVLQIGMLISGNYILRITFCIKTNNFDGDSRKMWLPGISSIQHCNCNNCDNI